MRFKVGQIVSFGDFTGEKPSPVYCVIDSFAPDNGSDYAKFFVVDLITGKRDMFLDNREANLGCMHVLDVKKAFSTFTKNMEQ